MIARLDEICDGQVFIENRVVNDVEQMGDVSRCSLNVGSHRLTASLSSETIAKEGGTLQIVVDLNKTHLFDPDTTLAIRWGRAVGHNCSFGRHRGTAGPERRRNADTLVWTVPAF